MSFNCNFDKDENLLFYDQLIAAYLIFLVHSERDSFICYPFLLVDSIANSFATLLVSVQYVGLLIFSKFPDLSRCQGKHKNVK